MPSSQNISLSNCIHVRTFIRTEELPARTEELSDYGVKESDK